MIQIEGIGSFTKDEKSGWYYSQDIPIRVVGGSLCKFVLEGYDEDENKEDFHTAMRNFLSIDRKALALVENQVYRYYEDCNENFDVEDEDYVEINEPKDVWRFVEFGNAAAVSRRSSGDRKVYVSLECSCEWEQEHGLQIVFQEGLRVNKIGPFDGHLTNSDAYADPTLEDVIYH